MINRSAQRYISELASYYPVITITGPRQSGKTTLAELCFPNYSYCTLENPDTREFADTDPRGFLEHYDSSVIIDEVQRVPNLLSYIQGVVDKRKKKADFILTGSHQPLLAQSITQSLAGRTGIVRLYPFTQSEIVSIRTSKKPFDLCFSGFFPAVQAEKVPPGIFYPNYYQTYLERDVRQLINLKNTRQFQTFIRLIAGRTGQLVNYNSIAADSGVSNNTVKEWISVLIKRHRGH
nr:ATP-binding protein [Spirochaetota bacterium]